MAKYNRSQRGKKRRWFKNVGDPIDLRKVNIPNPNDSGFKKG